MHLLLIFHTQSSMNCFFLTFLGSLKNKEEFATTITTRRKKDEYVWIEATHEEAREKISHCFRRLRELDNQQQQEGNRN